MTMTPPWLSEVVASYAKDPAATSLLQQLAVNPEAHPPYSLSGGVIRYKGRIWLGSNKNIQLRVISALHNSALGGHSGFPVTHSRIKQPFAGARNEVRHRPCSLFL